MKRRSRNVLPGSDITLASFANSPVPISRMKKSQSSPLDLASKPQEDEVSDWFNVDEDELVEKFTNATVETKKKTKHPADELESAVSQDESFQYDLWEKISYHISPEDVGRFAAICRSTYQMVGTIAFWRRMYKRYYMKALDKSDQFLPDSMTRLKGYRTRVIRMLHVCYFPEARSASRKSFLWPDLDVLIRWKCLSHWIDKRSARLVVINFKLRNPNVIDTKYLWTPDEEFEESDFQVNREFMEDICNINHNPDNGVKFLQIASANLVPIPPVIGFNVQQIGLSVGHDMKHHKLQLELSQGDARIHHKDATKVVIDGVKHIRLHDWWSPEFYTDTDSKEPHFPGLHHHDNDPFHDDAL